MSNDRTIQPYAPAPITSASQHAPTLDFSKIPPEIMALAASIAADVQGSGGSINPAQALAAAYHFQTTGETPGRHSYVGTKGSVAGKVLEGYRGVTRELDMAKYEFHYRPLTPDERDLHEVRDGDRSVICELTIIAARKECIENKLPYHPILGVTRVRKDETISVPKTKTAYWVLCKQARVDALRQVGENVSTDEVLDEAAAAGVKIEKPEGYLSQEQAEALVRQAVAAAQRPTLTGEQLQAAAAANVQTMRGAKTADPLGIDEQPGKPATAELQDDPGDPNTEWDKLQSATAERAAENTAAFVPPVCPKCGGAMKDERAKREQAKAEGKPKPPPAWKCAAGSWSKEGGQIGCDGVIWPSDPNEEGTQVQTSKPPAAPKPSPAVDIITAINDLAVKLYGREAAGPTMKPWLNDGYGVIGPSLKATLALLTPEQQQDVLTKLQVAAAKPTAAPTA